MDRGVMIPMYAHWTNFTTVELEPLEAINDLLLPAT